MKRTWKTACAMTTAFCFVLVTQAVGQVKQPGDQAREIERRAGGQQKVCLASKFQGMMVKDKANQSLGSIQDLVITQDGKVQYLAISTGENSGATGATKAPLQPRRTPGQAPNGADQAGKVTLVPFDAVQFHEGETETQNYVSLNIDKDRITQAPTFARQQLTSKTQQQWMSQVDQFFNRTKGAARPELNNRNKDGAARPDLNNRNKNGQERDQ